ncbi:MAG: hypothetical protein K0U86_02900 [Planctomycetes bacterium]|nr:hypothetical protein [Planctomycetota bacterium]MCH9723838.1 hypothetical protein [Planctomycetota bacterium]MCH9776257.1 hypothetical protein [Planctomycetota bacterium]MCH9791800.1 hypothetical protein [Planctomycetota bacterium]
MQLSLKLTGLLGLLAAILVGTGEFLIHFDPLARFSDSSYDFMLDTTETRLTTGHFFAMIGIPFYFIGSWHIYQMLRSASNKLAFTAFLIASYGFIFGAVWMGSRASIGSLAHHAELIKGTDLVSLYQLRYETLLQVIRITTLILSGIYIYLVLTGRTRYPKWMAAVNPIVLILLSFLIFAFNKDIGIYIMPIALNVAFAIFFTCSLLFGDTCPEEVNE